MCANALSRPLFSCYGISKQTPNDVKPLQFSNRGSGDQFNDRRMAFRMLRFDLPPDNSADGPCEPRWETPHFRRKTKTGTPERKLMPTRDIIVIGASAGGVQALSNLVSELPGHLPAAVFIVLHVASHAPSLLPSILARESKLPVSHAIDGEAISGGRIYVAPPDHHLLVEDERVKLVRGPTENLHRPSIDTLFRSAARWAGPRVIGVILTGARDDGKVGMRAIKQRGGVTIVQDPLEALFPSMPMSVMQDIKVDYSIPLRDVAPLLDQLS